MYTDTARPTYSVLRTYPAGDVVAVLFVVADDDVDNERHRQHAQKRRYQQARRLRQPIIPAPHSGGLAQRSSLNLSCRGRLGVLPGGRSSARRVGLRTKQLWPLALRLQLSKLWNWLILGPLADRRRRDAKKAGQLGIRGKAEGVSDPAFGKRSVHGERSLSALKLFIKPAKAGGS